MYYAVTINSEQIVTGVHESLTPITLSTFMANPDMADDTVILLDERKYFVTGEHIFCYNEDGTRKSDLWCIENGYMEMPPDKEIINGELIDIKKSAEEQPQTLKEYFIQRFIEAEQKSEKTTNAIKPLINELLICKSAAVVLPLVPMMDEWKEGKWTAGKSLTHNGYPYKVVQTHDSTGNPTWAPDATPALFAPWHGVSMETALPWKAPTGMQDMYKANEYMVWTDGKTYRCKSDTAYSLIEYAQAWQLIS